jgi:hypothetical protein
MGDPSGGRENTECEHQVPFQHSPEGPPAEYLSWIFPVRPTCQYEWGNVQKCRENDMYMYMNVERCRNMQFYAVLEISVYREM